MAGTVGGCEHNMCIYKLHAGWGIKKDQ